MSTTTADIRVAQAAPGEPALAAKVFAFAAMSVGFFIALLDIQIVAASLADIGGGLSAGADETAWVQTSYLIAEIVVIPLSGWLSRVMSDERDDRGDPQRAARRGGRTAARGEGVRLRHDERRLLYRPARHPDRCAPGSAPRR